MPEYTVEKRTVKVETYTVVAAAPEDIDLDMLDLHMEDEAWIDETWISWIEENV